MDSYQKGRYTIDHTNWIYVPPPEFTIPTIPSSLELRAGETKNIEVAVESVTGFEPAVYLHTLDLPESVELDFKFDKLRIPSYGIATTSIDVTASQNTSQRPHTIHLFADFTFPVEKLSFHIWTLKSIRSNRSQMLVRPASNNRQSIVIQQSDTETSRSAICAQINPTN